MISDRRAYLATLGAVTLGGCSGTQNRTPSGQRESTHTRSTTTADRTTTGDRTTTTGEPPSTTIGFAGDTMLGRELNEIYGQKDSPPSAIWGDFRPQLHAVDGIFCNLECCLSTRGERFPGRAFYFRGDPGWAVPALRAGNVKFTALANNHAMDFGPVALTDTIDVLEGADISVAGTGKTPAEAWAPTVVLVGGLDVAVVSFADEYEAYAATDDRPGIAWAKTDPENSATQRLVGNAIERAKSSDPDLLIVSVHWGENWVERPSDRLISFGHWLIDQGVDVVHGHSAHVVQAIERYEDGVVLHDTGDLVDDFGVKGNLGNNKSYLFKIELTDGELERIRLVPFFIENRVYSASESDAAWLRETIRERSDPFETEYEREGDGLVVEL